MTTGGRPGERRRRLASCRRPVRTADATGQALVLLVGALCAVLVGAAVLGSVASALGARGGQQRAADLAALAAARTMADVGWRLLEPAVVAGRPNPRHLSRGAFERHVRHVARRTAARNGARSPRLSFRGTAFPPTRVRVALEDPIRTPAGPVPLTVVAEAEAMPDLTAAGDGAAPGEYRGPLAYRDGKPMRPDVALAFDRLARAARADGVALVVVSGFRGDAEQAALFARRPDPKWVAPPGRSLHRLGTELDLGPPAAYGWLARRARAFGFVQRYAWEPWHFGFTGSPGTRSVGFGPPRAAASGLPAFVPPRFAPAIRRAAARWGVGAGVLAAQLQAESGFDPRARSSAGALGIAQFMPGTARAYGLRDPFDPTAAIDAQARLMRDLLRRFASVPLALAAYNAGPAVVARCGCVPPYRETQAYVARILATIGRPGAGMSGPHTGLDVRLVR